MINFPSYFHSRNKIEVELYLANYATKSDFQNAACVNTLQFSKQDDLANLKLEFNKLDIDSIEKVKSGLNNLKSK